MNRNILSVIAMIGSLSCFVCGCKDTENNTITEPTADSKAYNTYAVVVGMENSAFVGQCPGAGLDASRMKDLLSSYCTNVAYFRDSNATKVAVTSALKSAIARAGDGLVIFYYSGHGGSEPFPDTGIEEEDGSDEFYCLYDTWMRDNEMWDIIKTSKGRVFCINDCCHSRTLFRSPSLKISVPLSWDYKLTENQPFSLLVWSGCPDDTYSYGSATGGQFTNALLRHFKGSKTYDELWKEIKEDYILQTFEDPQSTAIGSGFANKRIFQ